MEERTWSFCLGGIVIGVAVHCGSVVARQLAQDAAPGSDGLRAFDRYQALRAASPSKKLPWTFVGPVAATGRITDVAAHPDRPGLIFVTAASGGAFQTTDGGKTWRTISSDLTDYDPSRQSNIPFATVFAIAESPLNKGVIYAGRDDGLVHVTMDEGTTWKNIRAGMPVERFVSSIEASHFDAGTVYVTVNGKRDDEFKTLVFKSADCGSTWTNLTLAFPGNNANVIREDPTDRRILYLGTDQGVAVSVNGSLAWNMLGTGLPATAYVHDIAIQTQEHVAVIATHGRGAYAIDLLPVRGAAKK